MEAAGASLLLVVALNDLTEWHRWISPPSLYALTRETSLTFDLRMIMTLGSVCPSHITGLGTPDLWRDADRCRRFGWLGGA